MIHYAQFLLGRFSVLEIPQRSAGFCAYEVSFIQELSVFL
jgi:hypothetical protein